jgi:hypothetical protein
MNKPAKFKQIEIERAIRAADKCGKEVIIDGDVLRIVDKGVDIGEKRDPRLESPEGVAL